MFAVPKLKLLLKQMKTVLIVMQACDISPAENCVMEFQIVFSIGNKLINKSKSINTFKYKEILW